MVTFDQRLGYNRLSRGGLGAGRRNSRMSSLEGGEAGFPGTQTRPVFSEFECGQEGGRQEL